MSLADLSRVSTVRLLPMYGGLFALWSIVLVAIVQWETRDYLLGVVDEVVIQRAHYLRSVDRAHLPEVMAATARLDLQNVMLYGLFDRAGKYVSGNIRSMPAGIALDGVVRPLSGLMRSGADTPMHARGIALTVPTGEVMVLARTTSVIDQVGTIIRRSLLWGLSLTIIPGVIGGLWLARGPLKRVRAIEAAVQPVMQGNLRQRLPISRRGDELDLLAGIVNTMLDELERLMSEVKGVSDNLAHDLRTPLTRVRAQLHGLQRQLDSSDPLVSPLQEAVEDVDGLLTRFRALLRISELESINRRAGFDDVDLAHTIDSIREIYEPLAEDKQIAFRVTTEGAVPHVRADGALLFEAISNLVDNAIKFTAAGGTVQVAISASADGPRIDVLDSGPGIPREERDAVLRRFFRGSTSQGKPGSGLGLSLVAAIVKLHGFRMEIANREQGAQISLLCLNAH
ncbi:MAG: sensor histidine kinase [Povalibacter sp.]